MSNNYVLTHLHDYYSLLDSVTPFEAYCKKAQELGMKYIARTNHGNIFNWVSAVQTAQKYGLQFLHGCEVYLTRSLDGEKVRDNYHTILIARNYDGVKELNKLVSISNQRDHFYYKPRLSFDEFLGISDNIISTSACVAGPLARLDEDDPYFDRLVRKYTYLEVQPHVGFNEQMFLNKRLAEIAHSTGKPLICGTDTHCFDKYAMDCRKIVMARKHIAYAAEDELDLTMHSYDEVVDMFKRQGVLSEEDYLAALENTNELAEACEPVQLECSIKYPILNGSAEKDKEVYLQTVDTMLEDKISRGVIPQSEADGFREGVKEENRVFDKLNMYGFMLFMHTIIAWCHSHGIPTGPGRGSVGGSKIAYILDITDIDPIKFGTIFSRFASEYRVEQGDIDTDVCPDQQELVFKHIIDEFGKDYTGFIVTFGTIATIRSAVDDACGGLGELWKMQNLHERNIRDAKKQIEAIGEDPILAHKQENDEKIAALKKQIADWSAYDKAHEGDNPYSVARSNKIKAEFVSDEAKAREKHPDVAYYIDGLIGVPVSQSRHPAGICVSPERLDTNVGTFVDSDGKIVCQLGMDDIHTRNYVKLDILGLNTLQIIRDAFKLIGKDIPRCHEFNFDDQKVWDDTLRSPVGLFQMEGGV